MPAHIIRSLLKLLLLVAAGFLISQLFSLLFAQLFGIDPFKINEYIQDNGPENFSIFLKTSLLVSHLLTFIIPGIVFIWMEERENSLNALQLNRTFKFNLLVLSFLFMIVCYPAVNYSYTINSWIPLAEWMYRQEDNTAAMLQILLNMENPGQLLFNILLISVIPALGEELIFRGIIQRKIFEETGKGHLAVFAGAFIFSFFHFQFEGFLPRLCLGVLLGYTYLWSRNLWVPIILHLFNNIVPILSIYFFQDDLASIDPSQQQSIHWGIALASLILGVILGRYISQISKPEDIEQV